MSNIIGNRNSTPESSNSSLRPPSSRAVGAGHHLRASADMGAFSAAPSTTRGIRPSSEIYYNAAHLAQGQTNADDGMEKAAQQWIADIDQYEQTLEEMAAARMDQDFKDELTAIEQWFRVLSEPERTAALYALLQQSSQVQVRFFIQVLQQMAKNLPMSGVLSPANFNEKDPMANRLSDAMSKLTTEGSRNSFVFGRPPPSPNVKRNSQIDPATINNMFPDAVAAIAKQKAEYTQYTGNAPTSNRNSLAVGGNRSSMMAPTISAPDDKRKDTFSQPLRSPWTQATAESQQQPISRPKSSSSQQPMGQFSQPQAPSSLRSRPLQPAGDSNLNNTSLNAIDNNGAGMPMLSPFPAGASWASLTTTPMTANFQGHQQSSTQADMIANATAMRLAAMSTVNNRIQLDDVRKYRRARSTEGQNAVLQHPVPAGLPTSGSTATNFVMTNEFGQVLTPQQAAALQAQQLAQMQGQRSRPSSPGLAMQGGGLAALNLGLGQSNGFLTAYDPNAALVQGLASMNLGQYGVGVGFGGGHEGYLSDASEINRGRSPRGRRGSSKPPEDPTDINLLRNIPDWLRALRLHKYNDNLKNMRWQDLVILDDAGLERHGVNALGARRKLLKVFEQVREAQAEGRLPPS